MIDIDILWCTQHVLRRLDLISKLTKLEKFTTPIVLHRCRDGEIQINDGHHRLVTLWLLDRRVLENHEYILCDVDETRNRSKLKVEDLAQQYLKRDLKWKQR